MAITGGTITWIPSAALDTNLVRAKGGNDEAAFAGTITFTGDASATSLAVNWIDGTKTLPFTPTVVKVFRTGGSDTTKCVPYAVVSTNLSATFHFTTAPSSSGTVLAYFEVCK